jgi:hypothetical protein
MTNNAMSDKMFIWRVDTCIAYLRFFINEFIMAGKK